MPDAGSKDGGHRAQWDVSWEDVERAQLETMIAATPAERLAWLEEAMRIAAASGALARKSHQVSSRGRGDAAVTRRTDRKSAARAADEEASFGKSPTT